MPKQRKQMRHIHAVGLKKSKQALKNAAKPKNYEGMINFPSKQEIKSNISQIKKQGTRLLTREKSKMILLYYYNEIRRQRDSCIKRNPYLLPGNVVGMIAANLCLDKLTVRHVIQHWMQYKELPHTEHPGNVKNHRSILPSSDDFRAEISRLIFEKNMDFAPIYATDVADFVATKHPQYASSKNAKKSAFLRVIRRYLVKKGFSRGPKFKKEGDNDEKLHRNFDYLSKVIDIRKDCEFRFCYLDETYVNLHHNNVKISLFDPLEASKLHGVLPRKGTRMCIISAIIGRAPGCEQVPFNQLKPAEKPQLLEKTTWVFEAQKKAKDYHANFDSDKFYDWWTNQLLPALKTFKNDQFCIILDNAKYHCSYGPKDEIPHQEDDRDVLVRKMSDLELGECKFMAKKDILLKFQNEKNEKLGYIIDNLARQQNHIVVRTPPYRSDLQPIEMVWSMLKRHIADKYRKQTKLTDLKMRIKESFKRISQSPMKVDNIINHVVKLEQQFYLTMKEEHPHLVDFVGENS